MSRGRVRLPLPIWLTAAGLRNDPRHDPQRRPLLARGTGRSDAMERRLGAKKRLRIGIVWSGDAAQEVPVARSGSPRF